MQSPHNSSNPNANSQMFITDLSFESHSAVMLIIDPKSGDIISANPAASRFYGWSRDALQKMKIQEIYAQSESEVFDELESARVQDREHFEFKHRLFDGSVRDVEVWTSKFVHDGKELLHSIIHDITERKHTEESLRAGEEILQRSFEKLKLATNTAKLGIWDWDIRKNNLVWDNRMYELYGIKRECFSGAYEAWLASVHPEDKAASEEISRQALSGEMEYDTEFRVVWPDKSIHYIKTYASIKRDKNGNPLRMTGVNFDITERKSVETALKASEEKYRNLFNQAEVGMFRTRVDGSEFLEANEKYLRILGRTREETIGKPSQILWKDPATRETMVRTLKAQGFVNNLECQLLRKDGSTIYCITSLRLYPETGILEGSIIDITDRKHTEEALRASEARFRALIDGAPVAIGISRNGVTLFGNRAYLKMFQYERMEEIVGLPIGDRWTPEWRIKVEDYAHRRARGLPAPNEYEGVSLRKDGSQFPLFVAVTTMELPDGMASVGFFSDLSERKKSEEALRNMQKLEALGFLAGGIAHDFNNLLGGIYGYIDLAKETTNLSKHEEHLEKAIKTIERSRDLTRQLITFAKGGVPVQSVGHLFPFIGETAQFALSGSNISAEFNIQSDLWLCDFDKNQISQVIDNIVINAKQAMPKGGTIEISAQNVSFETEMHQLLGDGRFVKISIKDTGIGIPGEILPRIFDPFFSTKETGHGLGLATCYSIIKRHGGAIEVESEQGKGSVFHVYLPATEKEIVPEKKNASREFKGTGTFVVMDDEEIIRDITARMLETFGYTVICRENGADAIELIKQEISAGRNLAGVIFDLTVPGGMGGKEAMQELAKLGNQFPVFAASGHAEDPIIARPKEFGFSGSICKPFRKSELLELLQKHFKNNAE